ncbi:MobF family relaxase [Mycobacterium sp. TY815]|uniref:MobF family relaxase n=1 Tax=Mycobacterium sp. TY815 TaxID=3050581 RepID=UPI00274138EB|nr:MobF family relaxase [Mycobacterium sp. TY815]MDP7707484.1 MobF family relaxase [Mycobacterium sp. TY815]
MSLHKLTAGDGYLYLIRQVAAQDADKRGRGSLSDYYTDKGESPGRWVGRGLSGLAEPAGRVLLTDHERAQWNIASGSQVTEGQMKALFGLGLHPNAGVIAEHLILQGASKAAAKAAVSLGRPFLINDASTELGRRLAVAYRDHNLSNSLPWNTPIEETLRAQMRTDIARDLFAREYGRAPLDGRELTGFVAAQSRDQTTSTAGYDLTFSPVKSFSVLWALAPTELSKILEECHNLAVSDTLDYLQDNAAFTRMGTGGVAQVDSDGFIAAQFTHRDSRAGDPDLHTHVAISAKVRASGPDGISRWLALDGRPVFKNNVAASEFYNTRLEAYAMEKAALAFEERQPAERGKRAVREVVGVPQELCEEFSSRRVMINHRYTDLAKQFQRDHGREPTTAEAIALRERANLETRTAKHEPRSLAEQRQAWRTQAIEHLGSPHALSAMLANVRLPRHQHPAKCSDEWIAEQARVVVETVSQARSSWQRIHIYAEAQRRVRASGLATQRDLADIITAAALSEPLSRAYARVADNDLGEPGQLRRRDGASIYTTHGTQLFTSGEILAAEKRVLDAAGRTDGRRATQADVDLALMAEKAIQGRVLNPGQEAVVREMACSGVRVQLALAPAGSGKTTAMSALTRAWEESGGCVLGLSPGASQAQLLRNDIGTDTDTVDKFLWLHNNPDATNDPARGWFDAIDENTLIIIDEAGKASTLQLAGVIAIATARGASVRLVGDDRQLASVSAGGVLRDIEHTYGALNLTEVVRFTSRAEAQAGLGLRVGDPAALAFYADKQRIHVGSDDTVIDMVYQRWAADHARGYDTTMLAPTNSIVAELNQRARLQRLETIARDASSVMRSANSLQAILSDGLCASVGDTIATRRNNRSLRIGGGRDFVRNGYRWRVEMVTHDGTLSVARLDTGQKATLPPWYVRNYVTLGYASTIDASQGMTIGNRKTPGTCHVMGSDQLTRQQLYTAMSRATDENHVYLATAETDAHRILSPKATHPQTALDVLERVLARDGSQRSATTEQRDAEDPRQRLAHAARSYVHAIGALAEDRLGTAAMAAIDTGAANVYPQLTEMPAWPTLRMHLALLAINGHDPISLLTEAAARRELHTTADPAATLDWRLDETGEHSTGNGPLRWLPAIPAALNANPDWARYLQARHDLVVDLAQSIRQIAADWDTVSAPRWARPLLNGTPGIRAEIAVFRAAHDICDADTRLTGPEQYAVRDRRTQQLLEKLADKHLGRRDPDTRRFNSIVDDIDPRVRRDPYWPQLAAHLAQVMRTGVDLHQLLADAAAEGPLPDQMPGAALWWRLAGRIQPAALDTAMPMLRPTWLPDLHHEFGTATAETIAADPAFARLVAAIASADPARWTPLQLLQVAHEHLRDVEDPNDPLRPEEYAQLLTYSIDLFTCDSPYDHLDIPVPSDVPMTPEEAEQLRHHVPDPHIPGHTLTDDAMLEMLGLGYGATLIAPDESSTLPPDPQLLDTYSDGTLGFDDLLTQRPLTQPVGPALANVTQLRAQYHDSTNALHTLQSQIACGQGPALRAADQHLLELRVRAERDRPYRLAIHDILARWADAETSYENGLEYLHWSQHQLDAALNDPDSDPLDIASARAGVHLATLAVPATTPAEQFRDELAAAIARRVAAADDPNRIITDDDVEDARRSALDEDLRALATARARRDHIRQDLDRAEAATARAFAEAQTRSAAHVIDNIEALHTELDMLRVAGDYHIERGFALPAAATDDLPDLTARAINNVANGGFTVTALYGEDDDVALRAMAILRDAAQSHDHRILWCYTGDDRRSQLNDAGVADTILHLDQAHEQIATGELTINTSTTIIVDRAATADPAVLADLAEHAQAHRARVLLLDDGNRGWPPPPSAPLLTLLQHDLPWSEVLSVASATPARLAHPQPDLDPVLDQADRCSQQLLTPEVAAAVEERRQLRRQHASTHRVNSALVNGNPALNRDTGRER